MFTEWMRLAERAVSALERIAEAVQAPVPRERAAGENVGAPGVVPAPSANDISREDAELRSTGRYANGARER